MSLPDNDLELLESYLDGELPESEVDALIGRLQAETALRSGLEALRSDRTVRVELWQSLEPTDELVDQVVRSVQHKVDNHWAWARRLSRIRPLVAAAACIIIGFGIGWTERGMHGNSNLPMPGKVAPAPNNSASLAPSFATNSGPVDVPLVDEYGRVVAVQHFESADDAKRFINDVRQWNDKTEQIHSGNPTLVGDEQKF